MSCRLATSGAIGVALIADTELLLARKRRPEPRTSRLESVDASSYQRPQHEYEVVDLVFVFTLGPEPERGAKRLHPLRLTTTHIRQ